MTIQTLQYIPLDSKTCVIKMVSPEVTEMNVGTVIIAVMAVGILYSYLTKKK